MCAFPNTLMPMLHKNVYSVHLLSILCCLCNAASDSLTVHMLIPLPLIMRHIYFRFPYFNRFYFIKDLKQWFFNLFSVLAFGLATIGWALVLHSQFLSLEFVSNIFALVLSIVHLAFLSATLNGS